MEIRDSLLGAVVVKLGLCTAADVEEALALQKKYRDNWQKAPKLGEALASLGKLSPEQVQAVLAGSLNQKPGRRFGEFLVALKIVQNDAVKSALKAQKTDKRPLGRIMVEQGLIREEHIPVVLSAQGLTPVYCPKCNIIYNVPGGMRNDFYVCPDCRSSLGEYPLKSEAEPRVKPVQPPPEPPAPKAAEDLPQVSVHPVGEEEEELSDVSGEPIPVGLPADDNTGEVPPASLEDSSVPISPLSPAEGVVEAPPSLSGVESDEGDMYGPFRISEAIGEDSHSVLYRAEDTRTGSLVALRMFPDPVLNTPEQLKVMKDAHRRLSSVKHQGMKRILEVGEEDGVNYITEEFVVGKSLRSFLFEGERIHLRTATNIIMQAAETLLAAHKAGVYHLGLRPSLIIIQPNGKVRVGGFGYPKDAISDMRRMAERAGEVSVYAAPELAVEGLPRDHRADVYSLGAVYYHLVTGQAPFKGESVGELLLRVSAEEAQPAATHRSDLPAKVNELISKMLSVEPDERPQSLDKILMELHAVENLESGMEPAVLTFPEEEAQPEGIAPRVRHSRRPARSGKRRAKTSRMAAPSRRGVPKSSSRRGQPSSRPASSGMSAGAKGILVVGIIIAFIVALIGVVLILSAHQ